MDRHRRHPEAKAARIGQLEKEPLPWHEREVSRCERGEHWFGVVFHLDRMIALLWGAQAVSGAEPGYQNGSSTSATFLLWRAFSQLASRSTRLSSQAIRSTRQVCS